MGLPRIEDLYYLGGVGAGTLGMTVAQMAFPGVTLYVYVGISSTLLIAVGIVLAGDYYV